MNMDIKKVLWLYAAGLFASALLASCAKNKNGTDENLVQVKVFTAKQAEEKIKLETFGTVIYNKKNDITALVEGTVYDLNIKEGDKVQKGDVLLRMKNIQYEIQKTETENQLNSAAANLEAAKNNLVESTLSVNSKIISLENSKLNLTQKQSELQLIKESLAKNEKLFEVGGIAQSKIEQMRIEVQSAQTEVEILQKKIQIEELGMRDEDLIVAGFVPSKDKEERKKQLVKLNTRTAEIQVEIAEVELQNARQNLRSINSLIENLTVRATNSGIIGVLYFENGEHITQNEKILTIVDMDSPYALVNIQEKDMFGITLGSNAKMQITSINQTQCAQVDFIAPVANSQTGNFNVKIPLQNNDQKIKLGMFVKCSIETNKSGEFFVLPESVVLKRDGNKIAFYSVQNEILLIKQCIVEMERDGKFYIESGITNGEKIVENPSSALKECLHVKII